MAKRRILYCNNWLLFISILILFAPLSYRAAAQTNQTVTNGGTTTAVNFPGAGCTYNWTNDTPGIGLTATGAGNILSFTAVNNSNSPVTATITATPTASGFAYVAHPYSNDVSIINIVTNTEVGTIPVGGGPSGLSVSPDGSRLYVVNTESSNISVINTLTNMVITTVAVGSYPYGIAISSDGSRIYVSNQQSNSISVINALTNLVISTITVGRGPWGIAVSLDGSRIFVANYNSNDVSMVNVSTGVVTSIPIGVTPIGIAINPNGKFVYVANFGSNSISVISTVSNSVISTIAVGSSPMGISVSPDGAWAYVTNSSSGTVSVINTTSNTVVSSIPVGDGPEGISVSPDGNNVYIDNSNSNIISIINTSTNLVSTVSVPGNSQYSLGNFVTGCTSIKFTITVNPAPPSAISTTQVTGAISACAGTASLSPHTEQFTVSGSNLTGDVTINAPVGFELSPATSGVYTSSIVLNETNGTLDNALIHVRSASTAPVGTIAANVVISSPGAANLNVPVNATINALPTANQIANQSVVNGNNSTVINFSGTANVYTWVNDTPGIGLPASGTGNISSFKATNNGNSPITATITATPTMANFAYLTTLGPQGPISVINISTNSIVASIPVGSAPYGVCISPDNRNVYIANSFSNNVSVINAATNTVSAIIPVGMAPYGLTISPNGSRLYVTNSNDNTVSVINTSLNTVISTIQVGTSPFGIQMSPDGTKVYVANVASNTVSVIDVATQSVAATISVSKPRGIGISPDGSKLYVSNLSNNTVTVIDTSTGSIIAVVQVGTAPFALAVSADGARVYVTNQTDNTVSVINTATYQVTATITVGTGPYGIALTPDGSQAYVANFVSGTVSVISTQTNTVVAIIPGISATFSLGNFISNNTCSGAPVTFTFTVNPTPPPTIMSTLVSGAIFACAGTASSSPNLEQFTVSGSNLTGDVTLTAPAGFEMSPAGSGIYTGSIVLSETNGTLDSVLIHVRSAATAPVGTLSANVVISSPGAANLNVPVNATINALPVVNPVANQIITGGNATGAVSFTGTTNTYTWVNDTPGIGLAANGTGNIASFTAVNNGSGPVTATITVTPVSAGGNAYIANFGSNDVSVISTLTNKVVTQMAVGGNPLAACATPDGSRVYVANSNTSSVSVINTATNTVMLTIAVDASPYNIVASPDGSKVYVNSFILNNISVISTATNTVQAIIPVGPNPYAMAISPDGSRLYVSYGQNGNVISVINTATFAVESTIPTGQNIYGLAVTADGKRVYAINHGNGTIVVIDAVANSWISTIPVGGDPYGAVVSPDGSRLYVTDQGIGAILVIDTSTGAILASIPDTEGAYGISLTPDGSMAYVTNAGAADVTVINTLTNTLVTQVNVGQNPYSFNNFVTGGAGCSGTPVTFTITVNPVSNSPVISFTGNLSPLTTTYGTPSASTSFTASGTNTIAGILVTPPAGFEVGTDNVSFNNTATLGAAGNFTSLPVYVRLAATTPVGDYSGNIALSSTGVAGLAVAMPNSTVNPASLTIKADDKSKIYNSVNPVLTLSYDGFVNKEGPTQLTAPPQISTTAITTSPVGEYPITVSGAASLNYTFIYLPGILTILPASIVIPNAFTPNGDGINDVWNIQSLTYFPLCTVSIYNRYGSLVYQSKGYSKPWDGTYDGTKVPVGTYYYIINLQNGTAAMAGSVTVIR